MQCVNYDKKGRVQMNDTSKEKEAYLKDILRVSKQSKKDVMKNKNLLSEIWKKRIRMRN